MSDLRKIDDSEVLDLSFAVGREEKADNQICRNLATADEIQLDIKQGQQGSTSRSADIGFENPRSSYDKPHSVPAELDHDDVVRTRVDYDQEKTQSPYNNQGEMDELPGSYFRKSSFEFKEQTFHSDRGTEDSTHSQESPLSADDKKAEEIEGSSNIDRPNTSFQDKKVKNAELKKSLDEFTKSPCNGIEGETIENQTGMLSSSLRSPSSDSEGEIKNDSADVEGESKNENYHYSRNSPTENRKLDVSHFTPHSPESHPAPEESPQHLSTNGHRSPRSPCRQKNSSSPERSDLATKISPHGHLSPSPKRPRQGSHLKDGPSMKHKSASPEPRYSPKKHRRHDRSISRSPIRRRDSSSKYGRDHHDRSRSRSPYMRGRYRSPRKRYSPRRRSPIGYHSRRPSPKRRPWSPPPNRRTGVGKPGKNLFVAGFSFLTTERDLERKFSRYGRVRDVRIVRDKRSGDSRGFGFLSLEKDEDADAAIRALDETEWNGRVILVEKSKSAR
ncbi:hypothetical protein Dsin_023103 [Dipteronia sinensis]|uniref:RRM domain-containing protein n=1 Tax=Dipteronia sinensis TaxID=43782 RepID=A0AAE0E0F5_9ROSI|nr:hypothetical protein Dsin_023103 [Dipteronia sinensis]